MRTRDFYPSLFLEALSEEMSLKEIAKKVKCSETTAEYNLRILIQEEKAIRLWKYGMWYFRRK